MLSRNKPNYLEQIFLRQFGQVGDQIFYRKHERGAPIPVTAEEKEAFRIEYRKTSRRLIWLSSITSVVAVFLIALIAPDLMDSHIATGVMVAILMAGISFVSLRASTAPARALEQRTPAGVELSKDEWQSNHFARTSWLLLSSIFLSSLIVFVCLLVFAEFQSWSDYVLAVGCGLFSFLGARALWLKYHLPKKTK